MLKKIVAVLMLGSVFVLTGFAQKDEIVTEDMLIGKWSCSTVKKTVAKYDGNGVLGEATEEPIEDAEQTIIMHFFKENNAMMAIINGDKARSFILKNKNQYEVESFDHTQKIKTAYEYMFISNDQFKTIWDMTVTYKDLRQDIEVHREDLCSRISME